MKANEFVRMHGIKRAKEVVKGAPAICAYFDEYPLGVRYYRSDIGCNRAISLLELKRLVESNELVKEHGTIERAKEYANSPYTAPEVKERLKQAIADVES